MGYSARLAEIAALIASNRTGVPQHAHEGPGTRCMCPCIPTTVTQLRQMHFPMKLDCSPRKEAG